MSRHGGTKLVSPKPEPENQALETLEESNPPQQIEESVLTELATEIECPRCNDIMELGFGPGTVNIFRQLLGLEEIKWGDEIVMIDSQAGKDDDDDYNRNATLIKTKQTNLFDFL